MMDFYFLLIFYIIYFYQFYFNHFIIKYNDKIIINKTISLELFLNE